MPHHSRNGFLTKEGYALAQQISLEGLVPRGDLEYLDSRVSVSGLRRDETVMIFDEGVLDEQHRRFLSPLESF